MNDGRLVTCGAHSGEVVPLDIIPLFRNQTRIIGCFVYTSAEYEAVPAPVGARRRQAASSTRPSPLDDVREAFELMEARGHFGKIVITP